MVANKCARNALRTYEALLQQRKRSKTPLTANEDQLLVCGELHDDYLLATHLKYIEKKLRAAEKREAPSAAARPATSSRAADSAATNSRAANAVATASNQVTYSRAPDEDANAIATTAATATSAATVDISFAAVDKSIYPTKNSFVAATAEDSINYESTPVSSLDQLSMSDTAAPPRQPNHDTFLSSMTFASRNNTDCPCDAATGETASECSLLGKKNLTSRIQRWLTRGGH